MQQKPRCIRMSDDTYSFLQSLSTEYAKNISDFISGIFYYAQYGVNPESGNDIKQFFLDVQNCRWTNSNSRNTKLAMAGDLEYQTFSEFMADLFEGEIESEVIDYLLSNKTPREYWECRMPRLTMYLREICDNEKYGIPLLPSSFIQMWGRWVAEQERNGKLDSVKRTLVSRMYRKNHPLNDYLEGED